MTHFYVDKSYQATDNFDYFYNFHKSRFAALPGRNVLAVVIWSTVNNVCACKQCQQSKDKRTKARVFCFLTMANVALPR